MGLSELAYQGYIQSVLTGAVQKAGRDSTIQGNGAQTSVIDSKVMSAVWSVARNATYVSSRKSYQSFLAIAPEPFIDNDKNGQYDAKTDCFTDMNGNGVWDADPGLAGQGGANDVTIYTMTVTYQRLFPVFGLIGLPNPATLTGTTALINQPYSAQPAPVQVCPH